MAQNAKFQYIAPTQLAYLIIGAVVILILFLVKIPTLLAAIITLIWAAGALAIFISARKRRKKKFGTPM